jgi:Cu(I)/Ag(I) efflux system membrane fusion protein
MKGKLIGVSGLVAVVAVLGAMAGYGIAMRDRVTATQPTSATGEVPPAIAGRKVLYWYDPMVPNQHFDKPGKSPFMDMQLVARYAGDGPDAPGVRIDPGTEQNLGIRLASVERGTLKIQIDAPATIELNDRNVAVVQARSAGFVERVYALAPGDIVARGAPLVDLLVPEWTGAQHEFLALLALGDPTLVQPARERLRLLGMPPETIDAVERTHEVQSISTVTAPISGLVKALDARTGMSVAAGASLARINGVDSVWLEAAVPEAQAGQIVPSQRVHVNLAAYPGDSFSGAVIAVLPEANADSRTLRVRIEMQNRKGRLRPGMFAQVRFDTGAGIEGLLVPSEAVIRTGSRNLIVLALGPGRFQPVEVRLGPEAGGKVMVTEGVAAGQKVVASGQFLIDSEASLQGVLSRLSASTDGISAQGPMHEGVGRIEAIASGQITLSHGPVKTLGWGPMTMTFALATPDLAASFKPGDHVHFAFHSRGDRFVVETLTTASDQP